VQLADLARTYSLLVGMPEHTGEPLADAQADMVAAFQKAVAEVGCALVRTLDAGQPEGGESKDEEKGPRKSSRARGLTCALPTRGAVHSQSQRQQP
jgi:hypothetical protein